MRIRFVVKDISSRFPNDLVYKGEDRFPIDNGSLIETDRGTLVVVSHENYHISKYTYEILIHTVRQIYYAPVRHARDDDYSIIGYYRLPFRNQIEIVKRRPYVYFESEIQSVLKFIEKSDQS